MFTFGTASSSPVCRWLAVIQIYDEMLTKLMMLHAYNLTTVYVELLVS